nr:PREDICTED: lymphocyte-specific protein 1 [Latimeria chalumnae]|eukprot:XP_014349082.1 PREDICTED: lymphocyte-specific protein 1 [Latimeria chalumnae]
MTLLLRDSFTYHLQELKLALQSHEKRRKQVWQLQQVPNSSKLLLIFTPALYKMKTKGRNHVQHRDDTNPKAPNPIQTPQILWLSGKCIEPVPALQITDVSRMERRKEREAACELFYPLGAGPCFRCCDLASESPGEGMAGAEDWQEPWETRRDCRGELLKQAGRLTAQWSIEDEEEAARERRRRAREEQLRKQSESCDPVGDTLTETVKPEQEDQFDFKPSNNSALEEDEGFSDWTQKLDRRRQKWAEEQGREHDDLGGELPEEAQVCAGRQWQEEKPRGHKRREEEEREHRTFEWEEKEAENLCMRENEEEVSQAGAMELESQMSCGVITHTVLVSTIHCNCNAPYCHLVADCQTFWWQRSCDAVAISKTEEKRQMKEDIERRRMEAAEKRQKKLSTSGSEGDEPFCPLSPRSPTFKNAMTGQSFAPLLCGDREVTVGWCFRRAEGQGNDLCPASRAGPWCCFCSNRRFLFLVFWFQVEKEDGVLAESIHSISEITESLNRSVKKSNSIKKSQPSPVYISKLDNRLEQYTHAVENASKLVKQTSLDIPSGTEAVATKKNLWEAGEVSSSTSSKSTPCKDVMSGDVLSKKNLWEIKGESSSAAKPGSVLQNTPTGKKYKFVLMGHGKYEKVLIDDSEAFLNTPGK